MNSCRSSSISSSRPLLSLLTAKSARLLILLVLLLSLQVSAFITQRSSPLSQHERQSLNDGFTSSRTTSLHAAATKKNKKKNNKKQRNTAGSGGFGGGGGGLGKKASKKNDVMLPQISPMAKQLLKKHGNNLDAASSEYFESQMKLLQEATNSGELSTSSSNPQEQLHASKVKVR